MFRQSFNIPLFLNSLKSPISFENTFGLLTGILQTIHKMHKHLMDCLNNPYASAVTHGFEDHQLQFL